jgi:hypothetical protein
MKRMTPTIPGWSAATMPTPKSIGWSHAYPGHWDQQQILVPTAGIILSQSLTLTSGAQGKTKFRPESTKTYNSQLGSCLSNHSGVHHEGTIPSITLCPCIQMHKQEVLALKKHQVAEASLYLQFSYSRLGHSHKSEQNSHFASCFSELWEVHLYITMSSALIWCLHLDT